MNILYLYITKKHNEMAKKQETSEISFQDTLDALNKKYGTGTVLSLGDKPHQDYDIIPTGSIAFDYVALGIGGFARGKLYEIIGWEGSGKTTICGHAVAECQKKGYGKVLYIDSEHAVDIKYFKLLGVNVDDMLIAQPECGEEGFQIIADLIKTGEIALVIVDSDNGMIPRKILDSDMGDSNIGRKAKLNSDVYPKLKILASKHHTCIIVNSQYREKIGVMFGDPRTTQGGHALKFFSDVRIEIAKTLAKEGTDTYGQIVRVKTRKNKMAPPFRESEFLIKFKVGINKFAEVVDIGNEFKVLRKYGKTVTYKDIKYEFDEFVTLLKDNDEFYDAVKSEIVNVILNTEIEIKDEESILINKPLVTIKAEIKDEDTV